jgi:hypothetical protein
VQYSVGDSIVINGETKRVKTLTSNTVLTTSTKFLATAATQGHSREWEYKGAFPEGLLQHQHMQLTNLCH